MRFFLPLFFLLAPIATFAQPVFQKTLGGSNFELCWHMIRSFDDHHILVGNTSSFGPLNSNVYLAKLNLQGDTVWTSAFGGGLSEAGTFVMQASDSGYLVTGNTYSFGAASADAYLVKLTGEGEIEWSKRYGGSNGDDFVEGSLFGQDAYVLVGSSAVSGSTAWDVLVVKTDLNGDTLWTRAIGGPGSEYGLAMEVTQDEHIVVSGYSDSFGMGQSDAFLLKMDGNGNLLWVKSYGGADADGIWDVIQTSDGGFLMAGKTHSFGANDGDMYLIKTDALGNELFSMRYGGTGTDEIAQVLEIPGEGYVLAGKTYSFGAGLLDMMLVKVDFSGNVVWASTFGGELFEDGCALIPHADGGFSVAGSSTTFGEGVRDFFIVRTESSGLSGCGDEAQVNPSVNSTPTVVSNQNFAVFPSNCAVVSVNSIAERGAVINDLCEDLALEEAFIEESIALYPNPASTFLTVEIPHAFLAAAPLELAILSSDGRVVKRSPLYTAKSLVDVRNLPEGMYFYTLEGLEKFTGKFAVVR